VAAVDMLVLGDANPDLILRGDIELSFGQVETLVEEATLVLGGSGAIMACGAARLGLRVALAAVVGDDLFGSFMRNSLAERDVDTRALVTRGDRSTGLSVILDRRHDRAIVTSLGAIADLQADDVPRDLLTTARHVHVSSYFLQRSLREGLAALFDQVHAAGGTTSIDPNWDPSGAWDGGLANALERTDVFLPNAAEARAITGIDDVETAAQELARAGTVVAVKTGRGGGFAVDQGIVRAESIPSDVVDTIGAGDGFDAGFLAGRLHRWPLSKCLRLAVACGSLSTRAAGGIAGQPTLEEALAVAEAAT
jgi:sugar/nucleoside kinase (ribokinase family)